MANKKQPNPIDIHVGSRMRLRRLMLGLSLEKLAESLGVTFQQVMKYEKGENRIGASRLQHVARALNIPISFFFEDAPGAVGSDVEDQTRQSATSHAAEIMSDPESAALVRAFIKIKNSDWRRKVIDLVRSLAGDTDPEGGFG
jgi:transcriptional regulator with XRE-family HTH domain